MKKIKTTHLSLKSHINPSGSDLTGGTSLTTVMRKKRRGDWGPPYLLLLSWGQKEDVTQIRFTFDSSSHGFLLPLQSGGDGGVMESLLVCLCFQRWFKIKQPIGTDKSIMNWFDTRICSTILNLLKLLEKEKRIYLKKKNSLKKREEFSSGKC